MFVCFAPRENPKIAIAVVVENAGYGATWAAPIASLLLEKYLFDTLRTERIKEVERIASANLIPKYLVRKQFTSDSARAARWSKETGDSSRWIKYRSPAFRAAMLDTLHRVINQQVLQDMQKAALDKPKEPISPQPVETENN